MKKFSPVYTATCASLLLASVVSTTHLATAERFEDTSEEMTEAIGAAEAFTTETEMVADSNVQDDGFPGYLKFRDAHNRIIKEEIRKKIFSPNFSRDLERVEALLFRNIPFSKEQYEGDIPVEKNADGTPVELKFSNRDSILEGVGITKNKDEFKSYKGVTKVSPVLDDNNDKIGQSTAFTAIISAYDREMARLIRGPAMPSAIIFSSETRYDGGDVSAWLIQASRTKLKIDLKDGSQRVKLDITRGDASLTIVTTSKGVSTTKTYSNDTLLNDSPRERQR